MKSPYTILILISLGLFTLSVIQPAWRLAGVAGILVCAALLIGK